MTQSTLLDRAQAGAPAWEKVPPLATCSYYEYTRPMGTAVRITRGVLRGVSLPNPKYTDQPHWPAVRSLFPGDAYFGKGLPTADFARQYLADLDKRWDIIVRDLRQIPVEHGRLVLLCFENRHKLAADPLCCHRRVFARFWHDRTGREVPELGATTS